MNAPEGRGALWDRYAGVNPFWAVRAVSRWDDREAFFKTGEEDMERILAPIENSGMLQFPIGRAVEFGCGVGRLLRPLSRKAREVVGVDISGVMLEQARALPGTPANAAFVQCGEDGAIPLPDAQFDLAMSNEVFTHNPAAIVTKAVTEMLRVLRPGGALVFNCPVKQLLRTDWQGVLVVDQLDVVANPSEDIRVPSRMLGAPEKQVEAHLRMQNHEFPGHTTPMEHLLEAIRRGGGALVFSGISNSDEITNTTWSTVTLVHTFYVKKREGQGGPIGDGLL